VRICYFILHFWNWYPISFTALWQSFFPSFKVHLNLLYWVLSPPARSLIWLKYLWSLLFYFHELQRLRAVAQINKCAVPWHCGFHTKSALTEGTKPLEECKMHLLFHCLCLYSDRAMGWMTMVWFQGQAGTSLFTTMSILALGLTQPLIHWVLGIKWLGEEADHSPPSGAEVQNAWSCTFIP